MRTSFYGVFGSVVLMFLAWAQFTGCSPWGVDEIKNVPKSVRDNPGSYRSSYGWGRTYSGGK
ncbi:MAG: hypothetical protein HYR98_06550 [Nitrospirae bacterium]|nr:hypothetical protein [Nitrospirota bacterium]